MDHSIYYMYGPDSRHEPSHLPEYMSVLSFERSFRLTDWKQWFNNNWNLAIYLNLIYVSVIFSIKYYMSSRKPYELRRPLQLWNIFLAVFSIIGAIRTLPELLYVFQYMKEPWYISICTRDNHNVSSGFWTVLFALSKAIELGDTLFIVLRKQELIFLHWYHHLTVLSYCWYTYASYDSTGTWFVCMNYPVHAIMYSYYALRAFQVRIPKSAAMAITSLQILQMVVGVGCNIFALIAKLLDRPCATDTKHILLGLAMYTSYFVLFAQFFRKVYLRKQKVKPC